MAAKQKAPHFPFYYRDFWHAVRHMSKEETHDYLFLLCEQADSPNGSIPHKIWERLNPCDEIAEKFELDLNGYFNVRMRDILHKRNLYLKSRKANLKSDHMETHMEAHMEPHMENRQLKTEKGNLTTEGEKGKLKKADPPPPLVYPFTDELFLNRWQAWKAYRWEQHRFEYKSIGEQSALSKLGNLAQGSSKMAVAIIEQSMAEGWKGFFKLRRDFNQEGYEAKASEFASEILKKHGLK